MDLLTKMLDNKQYQFIKDELAKLDKKGGIDDLSGIERAEWVYYRSRELQRQGKLKECLSMITGALRKLNFAASDGVLPHITLHVAEMHALKDNLDLLTPVSDALKIGGEAEKLVERLTPAEKESERGLIRVADLYQVIALLYQELGKEHEALDYHGRCLALWEKTGHPFLFATPLFNIGGYHGRLDTYFQLLSIMEKINDQALISELLFSIGEIYRMRGLLNEALNYHQKCSDLWEKTGDPVLIVRSLNAFGRIYHARGETAVAHKYFQRALTMSMWETNDNGISTAETLHDLCSMLLDRRILLQVDEQEFQGLGRQFNKYIEWLETLKDKNPAIEDRWSSLWAKSLKFFGRRITDKGKAQDIFRGIISEKGADDELAVQAMINLCGLLLEELKFYGESDVLSEVQNLMNDIEQIAQERQSPQIQVIALILKARFGIIEGNLQEADRYLDQATRIAKQKNLGLLVEKVTLEKKKMEKEHEKLLSLIARNASYQERLEKVKMKEYMREALKMVELSK